MSNGANRVTQFVFEFPWSLFTGHIGFMKRKSTSRCVMLTSGIFGKWISTLTVPVKSLDTPSDSIDCMSRRFIPKCSYFIQWQALLMVYCAGTKGLILVPRSRNTTPMQTLPRSPHRGFSERTNHSPYGWSPQRKITISGRRTSGPHGGRKEGLQGRKGSVTPLGCVNAGPESALKPSSLWLTLLLPHAEGGFLQRLETCDNIRWHEWSLQLLHGPSRCFPHNVCMKICELV